MGSNNITNISTAKDYLEEKVKLKISLIGIGNAGNQQLIRAQKEGYDVFAINSSLKDLSDSIINITIPSFIAGDEARGAGKNRQKAKELFKINGKKLFDTPSFIEMVEKSDIVIMLASTAGGTGSGIAPELASIFTKIYPSKIIIFYGILPKLSDSIMSQNNTINCMNEIQSLKIPYMLADLSYFEDILNDIAYDKISKHIIQSINVLGGKYLYRSTSGMIDENDMRVICGEPGYMGVYILDQITSNQVDKSSLQNLMIQKIKNSPAVIIQRDEIVKQLGVIINCPEELMEASKTGNYNELIKYIGTPLTIFENYSVTTDMTGQFFVIISGLNLPYSRILQCEEIITAHEEVLKRQRNVSLQGSVDRFSFLTDRPNYNKLTNEKEEDIDKTSSVLSDYFK